MVFCSVLATNAWSKICIHVPHLLNWNLPEVRYFWENESLVTTCWCIPSEAKQDHCYCDCHIRHTQPFKWLNLGGFESSTPLGLPSWCWEGGGWVLKKTKKSTLLELLANPGEPVIFKQTGPGGGSKTSPHWTPEVHKCRGPRPWACVASSESPWSMLWWCELRISKI